MVVGGGGQAQGAKDALDVLLDRVLGHEQPLGDRLVRAALAPSTRSTSRSRLVRCSSGSSPCRGPSDELLDDARVEHRSAVPDPLDARGQLVEVRDALLEQVADPVAFHARAARARSSHAHAERARGCRCRASARRIAIAARNPSSVWVGGIRMSTIATSGRDCSTSANSSSALARQARRSRTPPRRAAARVPRAG